MTVNEIYQSGLKLLENNNIENSKFEAQSLLQKAFSLDRVGFITVSYTHLTLPTT